MEFKIQSLLASAYDNKCQLAHSIKLASLVLTDACTLSVRGGHIVIFPFISMYIKLR